MRSRMIATFYVVTSLFVIATSDATVPTSITIQGRLTDAGGAPLSAGGKTFTFRVFNQFSGGNEIWPGGTGEIQTVTTGIDGLWIALLGTIQPLTDVVFADSVRWLEITVNDGLNPSTTLPRVRLVTGPYALRVATVDGASGGSITSKVSIGPGHSNTGANAFVAGQDNTASGDRSTIGGGSSNLAGNFGAVVDGGASNSATNLYASVGGGLSNRSSGDASAIAGGFGDTASGYHSAIGGGGLNHATGDYSNVSGGESNIADQLGSTVGGGQFNRARGTYSVVAGGGGTLYDSNTASGDFSSVGGGARNHAHGIYSTVAAGLNNRAGDSSTVGGGYGNFAEGNVVTISGGWGNYALGYCATIPGGRENYANGDYSFAAGRRAEANDGCFVWGDNQDVAVISDIPNQFKIRASNGMRLASNAGSAKSISVGDHYRDNGIIAWGNAAANGTLQSEFGVSSCTHTGVGQYEIDLDASATTASSLVMVASIEIDVVDHSDETSLIAMVNQIDANTFDVYTKYASGTLTDFEFTFIVTGR